MIKSLRITAVANLPVTLAEAKNHLRVFHDDDDDSIAAMIGAGVDEFERRTGRAFSELTGTFQLSEFPAGSDPIFIPRPPLVSVAAITYRDDAGGSQSLDSGEYLVDTISSPAILVPAIETEWPATDGRPGAVSISFTAGVLSQVPASIRQALLVWLDLEYHEHSDGTAGRMRARVNNVLQNFTLRHPGLSGVTV